MYGVARPHQILFVNFPERQTVADRLLRNIQRKFDLGWNGDPVGHSELIKAKVRRPLGTPHFCLCTVRFASFRTLPHSSAVTQFDDAAVAHHRKSDATRLVRELASPVVEAERQASAQTPM